MNDQQVLIAAIEKAGVIIADHIEPHARDPEQTISWLVAVLDTQEVAAAVARLKAGSGRKVAKWIDRFRVGSRCC